MDDETIEGVAEAIEDTQIDEYDQEVLSDQAEEPSMPEDDEPAEASEYEAEDAVEDEQGIEEQYSGSEDAAQHPMEPDDAGVDELDEEVPVEEAEEHDGDGDGGYSDHADESGEMDENLMESEGSVAEEVPEVESEKESDEGSVEHGSEPDDEAEEEEEEQAEEEEEEQDIPDEAPPDLDGREPSEEPAEEPQDAPGLLDESDTEPPTAAQPVASLDLPDHGPDADEEPTDSLGSLARIPTANPLLVRELHQDTTQFQGKVGSVVDLIQAQGRGGAVSGLDWGQFPDTYEAMAAQLQAIFT
ncbi:hypothetical protein J8273_0170 [Carpediemonas membranifera]|uniref:Uncharacterized protein n=1 Tax=Carpediemonas membranifera TaxID=201153 RepID=A0A8J6BD39_9EUKA|nr:hypothetical protein J8273_0170 [Carpediemonas membranifera]|eukprot:KAG9394962.1 hypothetical protein J8273_0170 [Carpediemonas membranifera]